MFKLNAWFTRLLLDVPILQNRGCMLVTILVILAGCGLLCGGLVSALSGVTP